MLSSKSKLEQLQSCDIGSVFEFGESRTLWLWEGGSATSQSKTLFPKKKTAPAPPPKGGIEGNTVRPNKKEKREKVVLKANISVLPDCNVAQSPSDLPNGKDNLKRRPC